MLVQQLQSEAKEFDVFIVPLYDVQISTLLKEKFSENLLPSSLPDADPVPNRLLCLLRASTVRPLALVGPKI